MISDEAGAADPAAPGPGPRGLPAVGFRWWETLLAYILGNVFIGGLALGFLGAAKPEVAPIREVVGAVVLDLVFAGSLVVWLGNVHPGSLRAIGVRVQARAVAVGAALGAVLYAVAAGLVGFILQWLYTQVLGHPVQAPDQMPGGLSGAGTVLFVVLAVLIAPVVEEFFFRGIVYRAVRDRHGVGAGLAFSAVLFGLVHYQSGPLADSVLLQSVMVLTGVGLALIYERAGTLTASIAAHMAFNVIGVTLILQARG